MKILFKEGITKDDLVGIKLSKVQNWYRDSLHFDIDCTGDCVDVLNNRKAMENAVKSTLSCHSFLNSPFTSIADPLSTLISNIEPSDLRVRVFGGYDTDGQFKDKVTFQYQFIDIEKDLQKAYNKCLKNIYNLRQVSDISELQPEAQLLLSEFGVYSYDYIQSNIDWYFFIGLNSEYDLLQPTCAYNLVGLTRESSNNTILRFNYKDGTIATPNGKVVFYLYNPGTGMKDEKLKLGVYVIDNTNAYFRCSIDAPLGEISFSTETNITTTDETSLF